jgi:hypothetical protein
MVLSCRQVESKPNLHGEDIGYACSATNLREDVVYSKPAAANEAVFPVDRHQRGGGVLMLGL